MMFMVRIQNVLVKMRRCLTGICAFLFEIFLTLD